MASNRPSKQTLFCNQNDVCGAVVTGSMRTASFHFQRRPPIINWHPFHSSPL